MPNEIKHHRVEIFHERFFYDKRFRDPERIEMFRLVSGVEDGKHLIILVTPWVNI